MLFSFGLWTAFSVCLGVMLGTDLEQRRIGREAGRAATDRIGFAALTNDAVMQRYLSVDRYWRDPAHQKDTNNYLRFLVLSPALCWATRREAEQTVTQMESTVTTNK